MGVNYLKSCMTIKSCTKASYPKELLGDTDEAKQMRSKVKSCYTGWQTKCINLVKAIRYEILSKHLGADNKDEILEILSKYLKDNKLPEYLKNDAKEPEKLIKHMKEHNISLVEVFGENAQNVVDTYKKMLKMQSGSNADDYNDMGTLQKNAVTAFEDLYKFAQKVDPKTAQMYEETKNAIDTFRTLYKENHRPIVENKAAEDAEKARKKLERELRTAKKVSTAVPKPKWNAKGKKGATKFLAKQRIQEKDFLVWMGQHYPSL